MKLNPKRGLKYGPANGAMAALVLTLNKWIRQENIDLSDIVAFAMLAAVFFGVIWTFTDKLGSDVGE